MCDRKLAIQIEGIFAVTAKRDCPHVAAVEVISIEHLREVDINCQCFDCSDVGENWICLGCRQVRCSRFRNSHGLVHFESTGHCLVLSFSDMSVWCYECDEYIEDDTLSVVIRHFRELIFGSNVSSLTHGLNVYLLEPRPSRHPFLQSKDLKDLAVALKAQHFKKIAVLVGAGISVSAGIPDFRNPQTGMREALMEASVETPETLFDINYFRKSPQIFFKMIRRFIGDFKPTPTHCFIRLLEQMNCLFQCYTQNIDGLELKAGLSKDLLTQAHGNLDAAHCSFCGQEYGIVNMKKHIAEGTVAWCECGGPAKPDVVFFGEPIVAGFIDKVALLHEADLLIIIGTTLKVFPFAGLVNQVRDNVPRVTINQEASGVALGLRFDDPNSRDVLLQGDADVIISDLVREAGWGEEFQVLLGATGVIPHRQEAIL